MISRYINILTDFGFKRIFADEKNKDLLIDFLNSILSFQGIQIKDITYKNTEFVGEYEEDKKIILDLYCISEEGEHFIIEVQNAKQKYFQKRIIFYASRLIQEQGVKDKKWDYNFKGVYSIAILDFDIAQNENILNRYRILNEDTYKPLIQDFGIILIDLRKFDKQEQELTSNFEKWLYLLKNLDKLKNIPLKLQQHLFVKLFNLAEYSALSKKEQKAYMESLKKYNDWQNVLDYAHEEGYQEAVLKYEGLLQEAIKQTEEEKKRAEEKEKLLNEEKKRAEQEKQRAEQEKKRAEEKEKLLNEEKKRAEQEKKRAEEKEKLLNEEKKRAEQEKQRAEQEKIEIIKTLLSMGMSLENVMKATNTDKNFLKKHNLIP